MKRTTIVVAGFFLLQFHFTSFAATSEPVRLYGAGSLRVVMTEMGAAFAKREGVEVRGEFGASGLMRERIEKGDPVSVFASVEMGHPKTLAAAGRSGR